jgi:hypothetical protein
MTGQTDSTLSIFLSEVIDYGIEFLNEIITGVNEYLKSGQSYHPNFDFFILDFFDSSVLIRWDEDPIEEAIDIPAQDFLNLLLELREYVNLEP